MNNCRKFYKILSLCIIFIFLILNISLPIYAAVYSVSDDCGEADTVYVVGNPDAYPLEYYSKEDKAFCEVFPEMLKAVSEKTNISFTYISASDKNRQKELSRNNQVEIVTALLSEQNDCKVTEIMPVLEISSNGKKRTYDIGFTEIASLELTEKMKNAFSQISENEKMGLLLANSSNNPQVNSKDRIIKIILITTVAFIALALSIIVIIALKKKKRSNKDTLIDELTGTGNAKYYIYAFEQLISRQSKNLYAVVYLACETEKIGNEYGEKEIDEIDRYAAAHLNSQTASAEYLSRLKSGVFAMLIQSTSKEKCESRVTAVIAGLNRYIQGFFPDLQNALKQEYQDCATTPTAIRKPRVTMPSKAMFRLSEMEYPL